MSILSFETRSSTFDGISLSLSLPAVHFKTERYLQMGNRTHTTRPLQPAALHVGFCTMRPRNRLSRETINKVLARSNQNGYQREFKRWKYFRAKATDELWQIDFKGPFSVQGKRYWFLVCIDDFSRFIIAAEQFDHELTTAETVVVLERQKRFPKAILSDYGSQFKEQWKDWCREHGIEAQFAHPSYPQDKGKVERCIQKLLRPCESVNG